mmetsp:Transcript_13175/g.24560  ORF Transcript_13175/g.24560 Transcript_13175/m.24560 type:complete len:145 (+) Transcript_13175:856-1290(+)
MTGLRGGPWIRYGQTKLANSAFAMILHKKLAAADSKVKSLACEPGYSVTPLQETPFLPNWMDSRLIKRQSAADGALNAAMACFSPEAESGDMYVPENGFVGKPVKAILGGQPAKKGKEKLTCDLVNQQLVWEACEKALDIDFGI